jgi:hypothetical protein
VHLGQFIVPEHAKRGPFSSFHRLLERQHRQVLRLLRQHAVAAQVECESKLRNQDITFQVQGLKKGPFKLWVCWIQLVQPHHGVRLRYPVVVPAAQSTRGDDLLTVPRPPGCTNRFCKQNLNPKNQLIGSRVETRRLQAMCQLHSTCTAPPGLAIRRRPQVPRRGLGRHGTVGFARKVKIHKVFLLPA